MGWAGWRETCLLALANIICIATVTKSQLKMQGENNNNHHNDYKKPMLSHNNPSGLQVLNLSHKYCCEGSMKYGKESVNNTDK